MASNYMLFIAKNAYLLNFFNFDFVGIYEDHFCDTVYVSSQYLFWFTCSDRGGLWGGGEGRIPPLKIRGTPPSLEIKLETLGAQKGRAGTFNFDF